MGGGALTRESDARIRRSSDRCSRSDSFAFRGPAIGSDSNGEKYAYHELNIEKPDDYIKLSQCDGGWLAGMQHHFTSGIVPDASKAYKYSLRGNGREYILGVVGPTETVAPGTRAVIKENLFVGPKLQKQLVTLHPELDHVADYGMAHVAREAAVLVSGKGARLGEATGAWPSSSSPSC